jgi:uncharacterized protein
MNLIQFTLVLTIRMYRLLVSPVLSAIFSPLGLGCRFTPTCSQYALEAVHEQGAWRGTLLATKRLCRCHPWGGSGYDPVPHRPLTRDHNRHLDLPHSFEPESKIKSKSKIKITIERDNFVTAAATRKT